MTIKARRSPVFTIFGLACLGTFFLTGLTFPTAHPGAYSPGAVITQTVTPTPTKTGTPTITRTPTPASMTNNSMNTGGDGDIIEELLLFGVGGGGSKCLEPPLKPLLNSDTTTMELMSVFSLSSCGWQPGEKVEVEVRDPSRKRLARFKAQAGGKDMTYPPPGNITNLLYQPPIDAPTGNYTFTIKGKSGTLTRTVRVTRPSGPHMYLLSADPWKPLTGLSGKRNSLLLWGFAPGEKVRLILYRIIAREKMNPVFTLFGYQDYTLTGEGRLQIDLNLNGVGDQQGLFVLAHGARSGNVLLSKSGDVTSLDPLGLLSDLYCPGAMPSRIHVDEASVLAAYVDGSQLRIREQPGFSSRILQQVPEGTYLTKVSANQFRCVDKTFWLQVYLPGSKGKTGWVAETYNGKYIVVSVSKK